LLHSEKLGDDATHLQGLRGKVVVGRSPSSWASWPLRQGDLEEIPCNFSLASVATQQRKTQEFVLSAMKPDQATIRLKRSRTCSLCDIRFLRRVIHKLIVKDYNEHKLVNLVIFKRL
jgi:hypothetical protein